MTEEVQSALPAEVVATEQAEIVEQTTPESTPEQTQESEQAPEPEAPKKEPWFQKRIGELTREKYEARREAEEARREAAQIREQIAQGDTTQQPIGDVQTLIQREAARIVSEQRFNESCNKVYETGAKEFKDFDASVSNLQMVGVNRDFLELATASDVGAKLLHHLGTNLDEAARIASLSPVQMARAMTLLEVELGKTPVKKVSGAPAPIATIGASKSVSKNPDEMSFEEFSKWRRDKIKSRN